MTLTQINDLLTEIRGGRVMDVYIFLTLANLAKNTFEAKRTWRRLIACDSSNTQTSSDTIATGKPLPSDFGRALTKNPLTLVDPNNSSSFKKYTEIPMERRDEYVDCSGYFYIDYANGMYYLTGSVDRTYTHRFYYSKITTQFSNITLSETWSFPAQYHPYIAFEVAVMDELGMDYDDINARQGSANAARAAIIMTSAVMDDESLWRAALNV